MKKKLPTIVLMSFLLSCNNNNNEQSGEGEWIIGDREAQTRMIEEQFRGFGVVMWEVVYRYNELYWAGQDKNWEYAEHQLEEIQSAMENGTIRRPERSESTNEFLESALPPMHLAVQQRDSALFAQNFERLRTECISCHMKEDHGYIQPIIPEHRTSLVRPN